MTLFLMEVGRKEPRQLSCYVFAMKEEKPSVHLPPSSIIEQRGNVASFICKSGHRHAFPHYSSRPIDHF